MMTPKFVVWFNEVDKEDIPLVGGKGANLGEMTKAGFPVPTGFIVTVNAYQQFLEHNRLQDKIRKELEGLDVSDAKKLEKALHIKLVEMFQDVEIKAANQKREGFTIGDLIAVKQSKK